MKTSYREEQIELFIQNNVKVKIEIENKVGNRTVFSDEKTIRSIKTSRHCLMKTDYKQPVIQINFIDAAPTYIGYFTNVIIRNHAFDIISQNLHMAYNMRLNKCKIILPYDEFFKKSPNIYNVLEIFDLNGNGILSEIFNYYERDIRNIFKDLLFEMDYFKEVQIMNILYKIFVQRNFKEVSREDFAHTMSQIPSKHYITDELINEGIIPYTLWYYLYNEIKIND